MSRLILLHTSSPKYRTAKVEHKQRQTVRTETKKQKEKEKENESLTIRPKICNPREHLSALGQFLQNLIKS